MRAATLPSRRCTHTEIVTSGKREIVLRRLDTASLRISSGAYMRCVRAGALQPLVQMLDHGAGHIQARHQHP